MTSPKKKIIKQDNSDDDFLEEISLEVDENQAPERIDKYIVSLCKVGSRNKIQQAAKVGNVLVNGLPVKSNYKVRPLDSILLVIPRNNHTPDLSPENIPLDIIYEDDDLIVLNKPSGLVVHPGVGNRNGTLVNALLFHTSNLAGKDAERAGLVHRIDKDTSGLLVIAKTEFAMSHLAKQFFDRTIQRRYTALVWGDVENNEGTVEGNIGRDLRDGKKYTVFPRGDMGKSARTHFKVIERFAFTTLIECKLDTGRTHQIRVHMKHLGHTVYNDEKYGGNRILKGTVYQKYKKFVDNTFEVCTRQALHARSLGFIHPKTKKEMYFEQEVPQDMQILIEKWRKYSNNLYKQKN